jgi:uncharacterized protein YbjQ (UPF0145 family)
MSQGQQGYAYAQGQRIDLPVHARERLAEMKEKKLFTSDLSVSEFLLVKEAGFDPLGLVMGSSIYQIAPNIPRLPLDQPGCELYEMTRALYHARELAMGRMEEEADALGADGIVGVRLTVNLNTDPQRQQWDQWREWQRWSRRVGMQQRQINLGPQIQVGGLLGALIQASSTPGLMTRQAFPTANWQQTAWQQWMQYCQMMGWGAQPPPWMRQRQKASYALGQNVAEFLAVGTAVKHRGGDSFKNKHGKPFQSDLTGQDFWTLVQSGYRPVGFVMGNCVYYVPPHLLQGPRGQGCELPAYTHALYDARELAIERLQLEAEALGATGIVGVTVTEKQHSWRTGVWNAGNAALQTGELIELFVLGTAVIPMGGAGAAEQPPKPSMAIVANEAPVVEMAEGGEE